MAARAFSVQYCRGRPGNRTHRWRKHKYSIVGSKVTRHLLSMRQQPLIVQRVSRIRWESSGKLNIMLNQPNERDMCSSTYPRRGNQLSNIQSESEPLHRERYENLPTRSQSDRQMLSSKPTSEPMMSRRLVLLGFHGLLLPDILGIHFCNLWICSRVPCRCCKPGCPKEETSLGSGSVDGRETEAEGSEVTMVEDSKCFVMFGRVGGREDAAAGCASNEVKSMALF